MSKRLTKDELREIDARLMRQQRDNPDLAHLYWDCERLLEEVRFLRGLFSETDARATEAAADYIGTTAVSDTGPRNLRDLAARLRQALGPD